MNEDVMALIQEAQKAGVEVPESFRNISFSVDQTKQKLESLKNSIQGLSGAFGLISGGAQTIMEFYDTVLAVEQALGKDVELTEAASQSKQRLAAASQTLNFMMNGLNMVMQALQLQQLGAKEAGDMLLNTFTAMIDATEDGIVTKEEFIGILRQLGVDAENVAGSLHNVLITALEATREAVKGNIDAVSRFVQKLRELDGMTVHTYHYHHEITVHGRGKRETRGEKWPANWYGGGPPPAQRGAWFTHEGLYYLHRGEMILPRNVAEWFRRGGSGVGSKVINIHNEFVLNNPVIRSEADIDELAEKISRKMASRLRVMSW